MLSNRTNDVRVVHLRKHHHLHIFFVCPFFFHSFFMTVILWCATKIEKLYSHIYQVLFFFFNYRTKENTPVYQIHLSL